jgi:carbonic anhydrase
MKGMRSVSSAALGALLATILPAVGAPALAAPPPAAALRSHALPALAAPPAGALPALRTATALRASPPPARREGGGGGAAAAAGEPGGCDAPWSYEGPTGPPHWSELSPCYAACSAGLSQSPVDLGALDPSRLHAGIFHYGPTAVVLINDGHTIEADYPPPASYLVDGARFDLVQFHFHHPSEHTWRGKRYAMELHLVHRTPGGLVGVVGVFLEERPSPDNPHLAVLWQNLPATKGVRTYVPVPFDAASLLPPDHHAIRYIGSLTTPPCTEGVRWWVLDQPVPISSDQVARFAALFHDNSRPLQPLNGRHLLAERPLP